MRANSAPKAVRAPKVTRLPPGRVKQYEHHESYTLWGALYDLRGRWSARLTLNNKGADEMRPRVRLFSHNGRAFTVPGVVVAANSFLDLDLQALAAQAGDGFQYGSVSVTYYGHELEMGAQVTIFDLPRGLQFDEQLSYAAASASNRREAVWWLPTRHASLSVVLTNLTDTPLTVRGGVQGENRQSAHFNNVRLGAHELRIVNINLAESSHRTASGGLWLDHDGPAGAVLARGFAMDETSGYSSPVLFENPAAAKTASYHGAGVRLDAVGGSELNPVIVVRNVGESPTTLTGRLVVSTTDRQTTTFASPTTALAPHETAAVDFGQAWSEARALPNRQSVGVEFEYTSAPGSVIINAASVSADRNQVFRIPLIDPETVASSTGGYMWRADGTTFTTVYVKNVTNAPQKYLLQLSYEGGAYAPGLKTLQPGETATIDLRALRDAQTPDAWGHTIPRNVTSGQVHWSAKGRERYVMIGRAEHTDVTHGVSASYACINCCPDNPYSAWTINDPIIAPVGDMVDVFLTMQDVDCYNTVLQPYSLYWPELNWSVANTGIATGDNNGTVTGQNEGDTTLSATYQAEWWYKDTYEGGWFCNTAPYPVYFNPPIQAVVPTYVRPIGTQAYTDSPPPPYLFNVNREILDRNWRPISKVMFVDETYAPNPPSGNCTGQAVSDHDDNSNEAGIFHDEYSQDAAGPAGCSSTSTQSFKVRMNGTNYPITTQYSVKWENTGVTITCIAGCQPQ
jgi:hypothetical protein